MSTPGLLEPGALKPGGARSDSESVIDRQGPVIRGAVRRALTAALAGLVLGGVALAGAEAAPGAVRDVYLASFARGAAHDVASATAVALATPAVSRQLTGGSGPGVLASLVRSAPSTSELSDVEAYPPRAGAPEPRAELVPSGAGDRAQGERIDVWVPVTAGPRVLAVVRADAPAAPLVRGVGGEVDRIDWVLAILAAGGWLSVVAVVARRRRLPGRWALPGVVRPSALRLRRP